MEGGNVLNALPQERLGRAGKTWPLGPDASSCRGGRTTRQSRLEEDSSFILLKKSHRMHHLELHFQPQPRDMELDKPADLQRERHHGVVS